MDKQKLFQRDVNILEYTATPDGTIYDLLQWGENTSKKILARAVAGYVDAYQLYTTKGVFEFKDLCGYDPRDAGIDEQAIRNIEELRYHISNFDMPRYHITRTKNRR